MKIDELLPLKVYPFTLLRQFMQLTECSYSYMVKLIPASHPQPNLREADQMCSHNIFASPDQMCSHNIFKENEQNRFKLYCKLLHFCVSLFHDFFLEKLESNQVHDQVLFQTSFILVII